MLIATPFNLGSWNVHQVVQVNLAQRLPVKIPGILKKNPIKAALKAFESLLVELVLKDKRVIPKKVNLLSGARGLFPRARMLCMRETVIMNNIANQMGT